MKRLYEGLGILMKYTPNGDTCADHDIIWAAPDVKEDTLSEEDTKRMHALGWQWDSPAGSWAFLT